MSGFTIPNTPDAPFQNQAEPDSLDFQILGNARTGVVSGMDVAPGTGTTVTVSSGEVVINGVYYKLVNNQTVNLTAAGTDGFFDIIYARILSESSKTVDCHATGIASGNNPRFPDTGSESGEINLNTDVVLASVWRATDSPPVVDNIVDKRIFVRSNANRVVNAIPTNGSALGSGVAGDSYVNTAWASDSTLSSPFSVKVGTTWYNLAKYSENFSTASITASGTITAAGFSGPLTGNVTGNVTGDVTGDVTGNLTGNVTGNISGGTVNGTIGSLTGDLVGNLYGPSGVVIYSNYTGWSVSGYVDTPIIYTNYVSAGDGDQSNPTYRFAQDTNTGMYHLAGDGFGSSSRIRFTVNGNYVYSISSSGGANASSLRYKENVVPSTIDLNDLLNIEIVSFNMKGLSETITGVIAEQLDSMNSCKQFVIYDNEGRPDAVAYDRLAVAYIALLKDHEERLKALEEA